MSEIKNLEPKLVWNNFDMICSIPHPSKKEKMLADKLVSWAKEHNIECCVDKIGNVIMRKPATKGMENRKCVILQAHLDMVPQKTAATNHDFEKDPIQPWIDGEWVKAKGTTLGADDGMGGATILAVLEDHTLEHGPLEALFTVDEETGMTGAEGLEKGILKGDILLNLDSETEGELYVGCAGGIDGTFTFDYKLEAAAIDMSAFKLSVTGLKGGHSGMDIILGRGNANKIYFRLMKALEAVDVRMADINGGSLRNAIPLEAFGTIALTTSKVAQAKEILETVTKEIKAELADTDEDLQIEMNPTALPKELIDSCTQKRLTNAIYACPNGIMRMSFSVENLVETSTNLAIVASDGKTITVKCLLRSSVDTAKMDLAQMMRSVFELAGAKCVFDGQYPGWKPNMQSPILNEMQSLYKQLFNKEPKIMAIHAGLECGLFGGVYTNWDMISFGPTIQHPHSPAERVNIESVAKLWKFVVATLKNVPTK